LSAGRESAPLLPAPGGIGKLRAPLRFTRLAFRGRAAPPSRRQRHTPLQFRPIFTASPALRLSGGWRKPRDLQARARSLRTLRSSTGRSGIVIRKVAPMVPSTR